MTQASTPVRRLNSPTAWRAQDSQAGQPNRPQQRIRDHEPERPRKRLALALSLPDHRGVGPAARSQVVVQVKPEDQQAPEGQQADRHADQSQQGGIRGREEEREFQPRRVAVVSLPRKFTRSVKIRRTQSLRSIPGS